MKILLKKITVKNESELFCDSYMELFYAHWFLQQRAPSMKGYGRRLPSPV